MAREYRIVGKRKENHKRVIMNYSLEKVEECAAWVREHGLMDYGGAMQKELCAAVGITTRSYNRWLLKHPEFAAAIKAAKEEFRARIQVEIEKSLARLAVGYDWEQVITELENDADGKPRIKRQTRKTMHEAPNVAAGIFLLTNLDPERWKNRQAKDVRMSGDSVTVVVRSDEERAMLEDMKQLEV